MSGSHASMLSRHATCLVRRWLVNEVLSVLVALQQHTSCLHASTVGRKATHQRAAQKLLTACPCRPAERLAAALRHSSSTCSGSGPMWMWFSLTWTRWSWLLWRPCLLRLALHLRSTTPSP